MGRQDKGSRGGKGVFEKVEVKRRKESQVEKRRKMEEEEGEMSMMMGDRFLPLSAASQNVLEELLEDDESVVGARPRSWIYQQKTFIVISVLGTVAFVALLIYQIVAQYLRFLYYFLMMVMFPIFLVGIIIQACRQQETFVAVTDRRIIQFEGEGHVLSIPLENVLSCATRMNYLKLNKELELKVRPLREFHTTSISRQAPFKLEYVDGLAQDREYIERLIQERIPDENRNVLQESASSASRVH